MSELLTQIKAVCTAHKTVALIILGIGVAVGAFLF